MLLRFRHCHNVTPAGGTGRSESLFLWQLRIAVPPCISLIIQHLFIGCSVPLSRINLWFFTLSNYLLVCMIRYMYIYFIHRYTYISSCIFISCLLSVLKWTSPLNSFPSPTPLLSSPLLSSPLLSSPLLSSLDKWINHPSAALRVLLHFGN